MAGVPLLHRKRAIAPPDYGRWLVPPAALAVELAIGQAYALSVFNLPLTRIVGIDKSAPGDWSLSATVWMFSIAFLFVGATSAVLGGWVGRVGPRKAMFVSALCFSGGLFASALAVSVHSLALLYAGYGVLGGIGLGIGYLSPVPTLLKWFPDRPGLATGIAVTGFGGGAAFGAPLALALMDRFKTPSSTGIAPAFAIMGVVYFAMIVFGAFTVRVPMPPPGLTLSTAPEPPGLTVKEALRTRAFWLVWVVMLTNITAGIGILGQAAPMIQEVFDASAAGAVGFVGILSLGNLAGRLVWSAASDRIGRKRVYSIYLGAGAVLYAVLPATTSGSRVAFVAVAFLILTMFGGAFATAPAYLRDLFGERDTGAILGRLLTAWAIAAMLGPTAIAYVRDYQVAHGVPKSGAYSMTLYALAALLVVGFFANLAVAAPAPERISRLPPPPGVPLIQDSSFASLPRPQDSSFASLPRPQDSSFASLPRPQDSSFASLPRRISAPPPSTAPPRRRDTLRLVLYWTFVTVPLGWGVGEVVVKSLALFR